MWHSAAGAPLQRDHMCDTAWSLRRAHPEGDLVTVTDGMSLGRGLLGGGPKDFAYISREQAECRLSLDGQLQLVSRGCNETCVKPYGTNRWKELSQGEQLVLNDGDLVALDKKQRAHGSRSVFVVHAPVAPAPPIAAPALARMRGTDTQEPGEEEPVHKKPKPPAHGHDVINLSDEDEPPAHGQHEVINLSDEDEDEPRKSQIDADEAVARRLQEQEYVGVSSGSRQHGATQPRILADRVGGDRRIAWQPSVEALDAWLAAVRPSKVPNDLCHWIHLHNEAPTSPGFGRLADNFHPAPYQPALQQARGERQPALQRACVERLLAIARDQRVTVGKWMVFLPQQVVDAAWADIAHATATGELGCSAKVAPIDVTTKSALCCVYVRDFDHRAELKRVLLKLQELMAKHEVKVTAGFKPDVYTHLGVYYKADIKWGLSPTLYSVKEVESW